MYQQNCIGTTQTPPRVPPFSQDPLWEVIMCLNNRPKQSHPYSPVFTRIHPYSPVAGKIISRPGLPKQLIEAHGSPIATRVISYLYDHRSLTHQTTTIPFPGRSEGCTNLREWGGRRTGDRPHKG